MFPPTTESNHDHIPRSGLRGGTLTCKDEESCFGTVFAGISDGNVPLIWTNVWCEGYNACKHGVQFACLVTAPSGWMNARNRRMSMPRCPIITLQNSTIEGSDGTLTCRGQSACQGAEFDGTRCIFLRSILL